MLTIKAEVKSNGLRVDGLYNVKIRFTLDRKVKRLSTSLFVKPKELTKSLHFKEGTEIKRKVDELVQSYRNLCYGFNIDQNHFSLDKVMELINNDQQKKQHIDFFLFSREWIKNTTIKGAPNYTTAVNAFIRFIGKEELDICAITSEMLNSFKEFLNEEHKNKMKKLSEVGKQATSCRSNSLYLISLKKLFNEAKKRYNNKEKGLILISNSPFDDVKIPRQEQTRKRAVSTELIKKVWELPYHNTHKGISGTCRFDLAKDCFILSFCLIGMNSTDLFNASTIKNGAIVYNRMKTKDRRLDNAKMAVKISPMIEPLIEKYRDHTGKRIFNFYQFYADEKGFNKAINKGLKEIGTILGIDDLEFYAARHSWATIALNKCGIDKYTVHSALNHVDESMRVTDIYIERDFEIENRANKKVLDYVFG